MSVILLYKSLLIAVFSVIFVMLLTDEGKIFHWWEKLIQRLPKYLYNPLGGCTYCMAGQISLWYYIFLGEYHVIEHIFFVSSTIFITHLIMFIYDKTS